MWPFSKINKQQKEIDRLGDLLLKQLRDGISLEELRGDGKGVSLKLSGSPLHLFADAFGEQFFGSGAENFLTMSFEHSESGELFEVTMQKVSGETVCDQLRRIHDEKNVMESILKYYKYDCSGYEPSISVFQRMIDEVGI